MNSDDAAFIDRARASLDEQLERTPAHISSRLGAVRHRATASRRCGKVQRWIPAMAAAALVAVVVSGIWPGRHSGPEPVMMAGLEPHAADFELLTAADDLDLYENMDFYLWLEQQEVDAG